MPYAHQGDVIFQKYSDKLPDKKLAHKGSFVLALGEQTGHKHVITCDPLEMDVYDEGNGYFVLDLRSQATITHEEHQMIVLEPGQYRVEKEREFDHFSHTVRKVID